MSEKDDPRAAVLDRKREGRLSRRDLAHGAGKAESRDFAACHAQDQGRYRPNKPYGVLKLLRGYYR